MQKNGKAAQEGGRIAKRARLSLEEKTGAKVVSQENYLLPVRGSKQLN